MLIIKLLLLISFYVTTSESEEVDLYYYGIEESERSLPVCGERQACSALLQRYWRRAALVRLCRCGARRRCDSPAPPDHHLEINNRADLQFCESTTQWPECTYNDASLTAITAYDRMNPDDLDEMLHNNIQLVPPNITLKCKCRSPNYWKYNSSLENHVKIYQCASLPLCWTGEFCGNVNYDMGALYQSCLCPKHHICVHNGGIAQAPINELLYYGKGWKAYCQRVAEEYSYEDY